MSVKELKIIGIDIIKLIKDKIGNGFTLTINGQNTYLDRNQAHLLMVLFLVPLVLHIRLLMKLGVKLN